MDYVVVEIGGRQILAESGKFYDVNKIDAEVGWRPIRGLGCTKGPDKDPWDPCEEEMCFHFLDVCSLAQPAELWGRRLYERFLCSSLLSCIGAQ